jgi:hypothetical protein
LLETQVEKPFFAAGDFHCEPSNARQRNGENDLLALVMLVQ